MQTAQIISRETGIRVEVDIDLHEWIPDQDNLYETSEESFELAREFTKFKGEYPPGEKCRWESLSHMRQRIRRAADKYAGYGKVIFVGHGMVFRCLTYIEKIRPAEIIECTYQKGQADCEYSFTLRYIRKLRCWNRAHHSSRTAKSKRILEFFG